jgi:hypothetical protein
MASQQFALDVFPRSTVSYHWFRHASHLMVIG